MTLVGILSDTTASIPERLVRELGIELVPYQVIRDHVTLRDMVDVEPEAFAEYLKTTSTLPTTSCPSPGDYLQGLGNLADKTHEIVALTMTSKGSGAYQSCFDAVEMMKESNPSVRVDIVDTLQVAMAHGWAVVEAARAALEGSSFSCVVARAREVASRATTVQTADTLRYLYLGGRIGNAQHIVGSLLNIKPLIGMKEGVIVALGVARSRSGAYAQMAELIFQRIGTNSRARIAFTHCGAPEQLEMLRQRVLGRVECWEALSSPLSPALAVHSGPGTVGVSFFVG